MTPPILREKFQPRLFAPDDVKKLNTLLYSLAIVREQDFSTTYLGKTIYLATGDSANMYVVVTPDYLLHVVYGCSEEMKALTTVYFSLLAGKPRCLYRCLFNDDPEAVVCEYAESPSQALEKVREVSLDELEETAYEFFTNTAHIAKTVAVGDSFYPN